MATPGHTLEAIGRGDDIHRAFGGDAADGVRRLRPN